VEKNQRQQQYYHRDNNSDRVPVFHREQDTGEIAPGVSIMRSNTPRPSSFEAILSSTGYSQKSLHGVEHVGTGLAPVRVAGSTRVADRGQPCPYDNKGELPRDFPGQAPSAPPLPEELEDNRDIGMGQNQILGLSFAEDDLLSATQVTQNGTTQARRQNWLITFSLYLAGLVLLLLFLAVLQGIGVARGTLLDGFVPLGVPWQVLIYGLLGGCVSCLVSLCNFRESEDRKSTRLNSSHRL